MNIDQNKLRSKVIVQLWEVPAGLSKADLLKTISKGYPEPLHRIVISSIGEFLAQGQATGTLVLNGESFALTPNGQRQYENIWDLWREKQEARKRRANKKKLQPANHARPEGEAHVRTKELLNNLGVLVGKLKNPGMEYEIAKGAVELDVVWLSPKESRAAELTHAFEVHSLRKTWKNEVENLRAVRETHPGCWVFLVLTKEVSNEDQEKIVAYLDQTGAKWIKVLRSQEIEKAFQDLKGSERILRKLREWNVLV